MELSDTDIVLLIDTIDRRIEQIKNSYINQPKPLVLISLRKLRTKLCCAKIK